MIVGSPVTNATYLAEDLSEPRSKEFELPLVQQVNQSAQLAAYELCSAREGLTITLTCKPRLLNVRVGEAVSVTLNEIGLVNQKCIVSARSFDPITLQVSVTLRSETDAKHDFALGRTGIAPPSPSLTRYDPSTIAAPSVGVWAATGGTIANNNVTQPAILIAGATDDENAQSVIIEYRPASSATYRLWTEGPASSTNFEITAVSENTSYVVAVSYRSIRGVVGARRELAAVTTGSLSAGLIGGLGPDEVQNALVAAGTGNRVVLSRFEKGTVNWFGFGTASNIALGTSPPDGLNVSATGGTGQYAAVRSTYFKVRPGEQLAVSALVGTDSNTSTTVFIGYQDVAATIFRKTLRLALPSLPLQLSRCARAWLRFPPMPLRLPFFSSVCRRFRDSSHRPFFSPWFKASPWVSWFFPALHRVRMLFPARTSPQPISRRRLRGKARWRL
jgi:hypothetical protein